MTIVADERRELALLLLEVGPDAPTLCEGWTTRDLAAHLVTRQNRVDAQAGIVLRPLAGWTERVRRGAARNPYADLVKRIRRGPPWWSIQRLESLDETTNALEFLVHHEDVRRAQPDWQPRDLPDAVNDEIWSRTLGVARLAVRRTSIGVALARQHGSPEIIRPGEPLGIVRGDPVELALWTYGRSPVANITLEGPEEAIAALQKLRPRL
jgi:uncharacterized protein (TIGR03085 family)